MLNKTISEQFIDILAPFAKHLNFTILSMTDGTVSVLVPENPDLLRNTGIICGQSILSAIDSLGPLCLISKTGEYKELTTLDLNCHFLRPLSAGAFIVELHLIRMGRRISVIRADVRSQNDPEENVAATAVVTYSFINNPTS